jgi:peptide alpha-N-acetyltransferase
MDSLKPENDFEIIPFGSEQVHLPLVKRLIDSLLSEPYSTFTYRYFLRQWGDLCFLALRKRALNEACSPLTADDLLGCIICKAEMHKETFRGYIAMIAVDQTCRRRGLGTRLVQRALQAMLERRCEEVVLETEATNQAALQMYEKLGFLRDKRLERYYLNGSDAFRLRRRFRRHSSAPQPPSEDGLFS